MREEEDAGESVRLLSPIMILFLHGSLLGGVATGEVSIDSLIIGNVTVQ